MLCHWLCSGCDVAELLQRSTKQHAAWENTRPWLQQQQRLLLLLLLLLLGPSSPALWQDGLSCWEHGSCLVL